MMNTKIVFLKAEVKVSRLASLVLFTALLVTFSVRPAEAQEKIGKPGVFYSITGNGLKDSSWLFGTYHVVNSSYLDESQQVRNIFRRTKGIVVEMVIDSAKLPEAQAMGVLKGKTLSSLLDTAFRDSLDREVKSSLGIPLSQLDQLKPMSVTLTLSIVYLFKENAKKLNSYSGMPLDIYFVNKAKKAMQQITALETMEEQMHLLFDRIPEEEQMADLKSFLRNKEFFVNMGNSLLRAWFDDDLTRMGEIYRKAAALSTNQDFLIKDRNTVWMQKIPALINERSQFIAVGALHLEGRDGLVEQLRKRGYTVTALKQ